MVVLDLLIVFEFCQAVYIHWLKQLLIIALKHLKIFKKDIGEDDEILNFFNGKNILTKEDRCNKDSIKILKEHFPDGVAKLEEASRN